MPGMNSGLNADDPVVVAAFRAALIHQGIVALLIFFLVGAVWAGAGGWLSPMSGAAGRAAGQAAAWAAEPAGRRLLRIGFGLLWIFDGLLQAQPAMAVGLPSQGIEPTAADSPRWVQHVVNWGGTTWSYHPIQAGAAAVWIQVGIGIWLMAAADGPWSRLAGLASAGWGLVVWVFGESFGGIFAPGLTWLFGAPGAVLCYCAAGALIALPEGYWRTPRLGRAILAAMGVFFAGMAVLQAWPGRGFWQGTQHGHPGTLAAMTASMAQTPQPGFLAAWVRAFTSFDEAHGFAVNLFAVIASALIGLALLAARQLQGARPAVLRAAVLFLAVLCVADWLLVEDLGFFGGLGTDPNSMIPLLLLVVAGYLALTPAPAVARAGAAAPAPATAPVPAAAAGPAGGDRVAGPVPPGLAAPGDRRRQCPFCGLGRGGRGDPARCGADGGRSGEPGRRPDPGRVDRRVERLAGLSGAAVPAHRPAWAAGVAGQPARQGGAADLPRPGVHLRLPADRPGVPLRRAVARRP